ncbi:MAG: hypothetical protein ACYCVN_14645 [Acidimicrobiales bacterium]
MEEVTRHQAFGLCGEELRQVGPDLRGDGSMPWHSRMAHTLETAMTTPMVTSPPWMRR